MSAIKSHKSFYLKDARGKLILVSELSLLTMINDKTVKPSTKVFSKELGTWMKVSELKIYSERNQHIDFSQVDETNIEIVEAPESDTHLQLIQLLDSVEDAKEAIYNARYEGLEKSKKIALQNNELKAQLGDAAIKIHSVEVENKALQERIKILQNEKIELLQTSTYGTTEVENSKLKAEINKLKQQLKLVELDYKNEIEINNNLLIQNEGLKKEAIELYERKEFHETQFNKIEKERVHFQENVQLYKREIEHLHSDREQIQEQFNKLLSRHEDYLNKENLYKDKYVESVKIISDLKSTESKHESTVNRYKDSIRERDKEVLDLTEKLDVLQSDFEIIARENDELTRKAFHLEKQLTNHKALINDLREMPPTPGGVEVIELLQNEVAHLKNLIKNKDEQLKTLRSEFVSLKNSCVPTKTFQEAEKKFKFYKKSYDILFKKAQVISIQGKKSQMDLIRLKKKIEENKQPVTMNVNSQLIPDLPLAAQEHTSPPIEEISADPQMDSVLQDIGVNELSGDNEFTSEVNNSNVHDEIDEKLEDELEDGVGIRYELDDRKIWKINIPEYSKELFNIFELKELIQKNNIDDTVNVKSLGRSWRKISDTFELNTFIQIENIDGKDSFFIERDSIRVPIHNLVQIVHDDKVVDAICTNISSGGCFLELQRLPEFIKNDQEIEIKFFISYQNIIHFKSVVKNVTSSQQLFGVGVMFVKLPKDLEHWIDDKAQDYTSDMDLKQVS